MSNLESDYLSFYAYLHVNGNVHVKRLFDTSVEEVSKIAEELAESDFVISFLGWGFYEDYNDAREYFFKIALLGFPDSYNIPKIKFL